MFLEVKFSIYLNRHVFVMKPLLSRDIEAIAFLIYNKGNKEAIFLLSTFNLADLKVVRSRTK